VSNTLETSETESSVSLPDVFSTRRILIRSNRFCFKALMGNTNPLSLAFIDLDYFKMLLAPSDTIWGQALQQAGDTIIHTICKTDIASRVGGNEFAM
jgi:GGDEF domain-containing protein